MRKIDHKHVIGVKDVFATASSIFLVVEYVDGNIFKKFLATTMSLTVSIGNTLAFKVVNCLTKLQQKAGKRKSKPSFTSVSSSKESNVATMQEFAIVT